MLYAYFLHITHSNYGRQSCHCHCMGGHKNPEQKRASPESHGGYIKNSAQIEFPLDCVCLLTSSFLIFCSSFFLKIPLDAEW